MGKSRAYRTVRNRATLSERDRCRNTSIEPGQCAAPRAADRSGNTRTAQGLVISAVYLVSRRSISWSPAPSHANGIARTPSIGRGRALGSLIDVPFSWASKKRKSSPGERRPAACGQHPDLQPPNSLAECVAGYESAPSSI
jgi:hypothetical protein